LLGDVFVNRSNWGSEMEIVLTWDPRWEYTPEDHSPFWASLDTVEYVAELLEATGNTVLLVKADDTLELRLREIMDAHARPLAFWLNEFMPTDSGKDTFTVSVIEKVGMMHTGPRSEALGIGLDKEATKDVFRKLGLPTPESYVVYPDDASPIHRHSHWESYAIIKPLLQGNSRGLDEFSVVQAGDVASIRERFERIRREFDEPVLVERYIGGKNAREFTVPMLISHDGRTVELPITEIDLSRIPAAQGKFRFLTHDIKDERYYLKIPAQLPPETVEGIYSDVRKIIQEIDCRDMNRVDMRGDSTGLYYIEVNVNPGKNRFSYLTTSAYSLGLDYAEIIAFIPYQAMLRYGLEPPGELEELVEPVTALLEPTALRQAISPEDSEPWGGLEAVEANGSPRAPSWEPPTCMI
jgi:D-alanine-D-alanine ligase-like ATP-grasp enzyme